MDFYIEKDKRRYSSHIQTEQENSFSVPPHLHITCEILYCYSGDLLVNIGNSSYSFSSGDIIIIPANTVHSIDFQESKRYKYLVVKFEPEFIANFENFDEYKCVIPFCSDNKEFHKKLTLNQKEHDYIKEKLETIADEIHSDSFFKEIKLKSYICEIAEWLFEHSGFDLDLTGFYSSQFKDIGKIQPALNFISNNYDKEISVNELAEMCNYSYAYFSKLFLKVFSINPNTYIVYTRVSRSETLLKATDLSITEIASSVGFNDASYFIRVFKKLNGISPYKYRQKYKE